MLNRSGFSKAAKHGAIALLLGSVCMPALVISQARADSNTDRIIQNVIQNILQNVRDQIQRRELRANPYVGPNSALRFSGEDANTASNTDDPFNALAYNKIPTKAPPMVAPPPPAYLYGINLIGSGDESRSSAGGFTTTTQSAAVTGAVDITKIGIFSAYDAVSVIFTGSGIWSHSIGVDSTTSVGAGTIAYVNGGFSTDFTVNGNWTSSQLAAVGIAAAPDSSGVSYSPNVQYKFELGNTWFIEPTVGFTYTETYTGNFDVRTGDSTEVHGGARIGFETVVGGIRVQPQISGAAFSIVSQNGVGGAIGPGGLPIPGAGGTPTGQVGGRGSGKLNFLWTDAFSSYVEAHGSIIENTSAYGASGGLRWTF
jgi:hypothetical protein